MVLIICSFDGRNLVAVVLSSVLKSVSEEGPQIFQICKYAAGRSRPVAAARGTISNDSCFQINTPRRVDLIFVLQSSIGE